MAMNYAIYSGMYILYYYNILFLYIIYAQLLCIEKKIKVRRQH